MEQKFSVLLSVYAKDRPAWLKQSLQSILSNTVQPTEVVVMVDGPIGEDIQKVLAEIAQNPTVRVLSLPVNGGRGTALAYAVPKCAYDLIALMDADDVCRPERFEKQLAAFETCPDLAVVGGQVQEVEADSLVPLGKRCVPLTHSEICQRLKTRMPFNNQTVMFKKAAVLDSGNFKPLDLLEDYYMWARVIARGYQTANVPAVLADMRVDSDLYGRRGGWRYFCMNKALFDQMRRLRLLNMWEYGYTLAIRFVVQVLLPNSVRSWFYRTILR
ncbi:MAG: glycosyltransferase [Elusimicrobiaceae bacterium]|nr:glycosyltransferase [Elusimicrobiaceae bacterium]